LKQKRRGGLILPRRSAGNFKTPTMPIQGKAATMTTTWKMPAPSNDWIGDKIIKQADEQLLKIALAHSDSLRGKTPDEPTPEPKLPVEDIPLDLAAEQAAFADLLKFVADNPDDDTEFTALSPEEFAAESFTPPATDSQEPTP
jgi:hypothetical protein